MVAQRVASDGDGGAVEHGGHEDVVPGAVDERDVPHQLHLCVLEPRDQALWVVLLAAAVGRVAHRPGAGRVLALVDLGVGVAQLDGDVALELILEHDGVDAGQGLDDGRLAVSHVTDGADVDGRLPENDQSFARAVHTLHSA